MPTCVHCEEVVAEVDDEDLCSHCAETSSGGPRYCCGAIYEEDEDTCMSCGEPL